MAGPDKDFSSKENECYSAQIFWEPESTTDRTLERDFVESVARSVRPLYYVDNRKRIWPPTKFRPGATAMTQLDYIKGIYEDLEIMRKTQEKKFTSLEEKTEALQSDIKELQKEFRDELKSEINEVKSFVVAHLDPFKESVKTQLGSLGLLTKIFGAVMVFGFVSVMITLVILVLKGPGH